MALFGGGGGGWTVLEWYINTRVLIKLTPSFEERNNNSKREKEVYNLSLPLKAPIIYLQLETNDLEGIDNINVGLNTVIILEIEEY